MREMLEPLTEQNRKYSIGFVSLMDCLLLRETFKCFVNSIVYGDLLDSGSASIT